MRLHDVQRVLEGKSELSWSAIEGSSRRVTTVLQEALRIASKWVAMYLKISHFLAANEQSMLRLTLSLTRQGSKAVLRVRLYTALTNPAGSVQSSSSKPASSR